MTRKISVADILLTIETEGQVLCCQFAPDHLAIVYGTAIGNVYVRDIKAPEEHSESSFDSDNDDFTNKYKPHS